MCTAETLSLTTWPARGWKQFLHDYILTLDGALERACAQFQGWFETFSTKQQSDTDNSAAPYLAQPWNMLAFP